MEEVQLDQSPPRKNERHFCPRTDVEMMDEDKGIRRIFCILQGLCRVVFLEWREGDTDHEAR